MARVLVVDDNEANRELLVTLLGYHGHSVTAAADGRQALDAARRERPDLVITDLVMPVMDGYELIREIRADEALATVPAIFCTANYLENEARPISAALGVRHLVAKPIDPQVMLRAIADALTDGAPIVAVPTDQFQREHQRAVSAKLADTVGELEHIEAALRASEARFRSVAEHSPIGIFSLDAAGSVTYANPLLLEICGSPPAASEIRWAELAHPDDREQLATGLAGLLTDGAPHGQRLRLVVGAGQLRWVHLQVAPVLDDSADVTFVGTVEDITAAVDAQCEREAIEARLRLSERLESLGELAAGIAHDFNNVLLVIMSYNEFIEDDLQSISIDRAAHARLVKNAEAVRLAADRAAGLTHRLLIFARRGLAAPELIDLNDAVRGALALLAGTIGARVRLIDNLDTAAHLVMADRTQLEQVAVNLVVNARDAIGLHGRIVVSSAAITLDASAVASHVGLVPGQYTRLTVSDDGAGIPPEVVSRVFEPFFTTKLSDQGTGLGLATVYGIARSLGGDVTITSGPGRGTEVQLLVPLAATGPAGPAGTARGRSADGPRESPEV